MRIGIVTHASSPFGRQYAARFAERGHEVVLFAVGGHGGPIPGVSIHSLGEAGFDPLETQARTAYLAMVLPLRRLVRQAQPDVLVGIYLSSCGLLACLAGHPRVVVSALGSDVNTRLGSRLWKRVFAWQGRRACLVHAVSVPLAEALAARCGVDPAKILVSPVGVDTGLLALADFALRPATGEIICTRAHKPIYDQPTLLRAVARLKEQRVPCRLKFTHARDADVTRRLAVEMGLKDQVSFLPGYEYAELPGLLGGADVYVSASLSDGTSQSLLEAMSTGTFPIVTDIPANRPWVEHGVNGFLFPAGDDAALADRLAEAFASPALRQEGGRLCRERILAHGDMNREADRLIEGFRTHCLSRGRPGAA